MLIIDIAGQQQLPWSLKNNSPFNVEKIFFKKRIQYFKLKQLGSTNIFSQVFKSQIKMMNFRHFSVIFTNRMMPPPPTQQRSSLQDQR